MNNDFDVEYVDCFEAGSDDRVYIKVPYDLVGLYDVMGAIGDSRRAPFKVALYNALERFLNDEGYFPYDDVD